MFVIDIMQLFSLLHEHKYVYGNTCIVHKYNNSID